MYILNNITDGKHPRKYDKSQGLWPYDKMQKKNWHDKYSERIGYFINLYKSIGYYFPRETGFDSKYFLEFLSGQKKVRNIIIYYYSSFRWEELEGIVSNISQKILCLPKNIF